MNVLERLEYIYSKWYLWSCRLHSLVYSPGQKLHLQYIGKGVKTFIFEKPQITVRHAKRCKETTIHVVEGPIVLVPIPYTLHSNKPVLITTFATFFYGNQKVGSEEDERVNYFLCKTV